MAGLARTEGAAEEADEEEGIVEGWRLERQEGQAEGFEVLYEFWPLIGRAPLDFRTTCAHRRCPSSDPSPRKALDFSSG